MLRLNKVSYAINDNENEVHLIKDASISIPPSKFMAIVGPSGCGKTTLLKIIAGINEESSGTITWNGRDRFGQLVASGIYYYQFNLGANNKSGKITYLK